MKSSRFQLSVSFFGEKMKAQGSLEYLIIVAAVLAIGAIVVLFLTGSFGGTSDSADISLCKKAASQCGVERATSSNPPCEYCKTDCPEALWDECLAGKATQIFSPDCEEDVDCNDENECTTDTCNKGYCDYTNLDDETTCNDGICCSGKCNSVCEIGTCLDDGDYCTIETCSNPGTCTAECDFTTIIDPINGDGCCPPEYAVNEDNDCIITSITGWIAGRYGLYNSVDGEEWILNLTGAKIFRTIDFYNKSQGVALGDSKLFYYTQNGGVNWLPYGGGFGAYFYNFHAEAVDLLTPDLGLVVGRATSFTNEYGSVHKINMSHVQSRGIIYHAYFKDVDIVDSDNAWIVGYNYTSDYSIYNGIIVWVDPTSNFHSTIQVKYVHNLTSHNYFFSVDFVNNSLGFVGGRRIMMRTKDAGNTWEEVILPKTSDIYDIFFINESQGWAVGSYNIFQTKDAGDTWERDYISGANLKSVYFINSSHGWVGGTIGKMYKSTDGGVNWNQETFPDLGGIYDIMFTIE